MSTAATLGAFQDSPAPRSQTDASGKRTAKPTSGKPTHATTKATAAAAPTDQGLGNHGGETAKAAAPALRKYCGTLRAVSTDRSVLQLAGTTDSAETATGNQACDKAPAGAVQIQVQGQALKDDLTKWKEGDRVIATVQPGNAAADPPTLQDIQPQVFRVEGVKPLVLFIVPALVLLLTLFSKNVRWLLFIGQDGRVSNSTTQVSLWFTLWVSAYVSTFFLRWTSAGGFIGGIGTPTNLLVLSGLSGLTFAGAKGITATKVANRPAVVPNDAAAGKRTDAPAQAKIGDLIKDDTNKFDFGDFQMLVITLIAVISYTILVYAFLSAIPARAAVSLPDVDGTVLAMFGVGQGAYLTKKAATGIDQ
ncbi:MAG: hypothetical protein ABSG65_23655 [Bryobacteraceae bacterium]